jgi:hypothetical protein
VCRTFEMTHVRMSFSVRYVCADTMPVHNSTLVLAKILVTFVNVKFLYFTPIHYLRVVEIFFIFWNVLLMKVGETMRNVIHTSLSHFHFDFFFVIKSDQTRSKHSSVLSIQMRTRLYE